MGRLWIGARVLGLVFAVLASAASADCPDQLQRLSDYERAYCEIRTKGGGATLPSYEDFRRNDPQVQALLLKRPAARWGVELPAAGSRSVGTRAERALARPASASTRKTDPETNLNSPATAPSATSPRDASVSSSVAPGLADCRLQGDAITCPRQRFQLATNQPNSALADDVLADDNRLGLSPYRGEPANEAALRRYLADAYDRYILKMLEIGLGDATMSFTEFYHGYHRHQASGVDYAQRMEQTFQLLKQDKRTRAVPARLTSGGPDDLAFCSGIGRAVVVCDGGGENWVFVARP